MRKYCARCGKNFSSHDEYVLAVLPGYSRMMPVCRDDRICDPHPVRRLKGKHMHKVREIAQRFADFDK